MKIKGVIGGLVMSFFFGGCAVGGVSHLGKISLSDGSTIETVSSKSKGSVGARITRLDVFRCREYCEHVGHESAASDGLVDRAISAVTPTAVLGGAMMGAAGISRPARTVIQTEAGVSTQGGGAGNITNNNMPSNDTNLGITNNNMPSNDTNLGITVNK